MVNGKRIWGKKHIEIIMINVGVGPIPKSNPPFKDIKYKWIIIIKLPEINDMIKVPMLSHFDFSKIRFYSYGRLQKFISSQ